MRHWTEEEAGAYLPRLRTLLDALRRSADVATVARTNGHAPVSPSPVGDAGDEAPGAPEAGAAVSPGPGEAVVTAAGALDEIEEGGIVVRDLTQGIVDFPSLHPSGTEVHLCWRQGEEGLGWWHLPDAGFAARRPLPLPPEL